MPQDPLMSLVKALRAKTRRGQANYLIDAFCEDKPLLDEALHFLNEGDARVWMRKFMRYRGRGMLRRG